MTVGWSPVSLCVGLQGSRSRFYGDGGQTRSFCYIDDMVGGLIRLMESDESVSGPINLGNPNECTILELAEMIIRFTRSRSRIVNAPLPEDDPRWWRPDISLAVRTLDWRPRVGLEEGLARTIDYFRARQDSLETQEPPLAKTV